MKYKYQIFVHVDFEGNVTDYYGGYNAVATDNYHYFFLTEDIRVLQQADKHRVEIVNFVPQLILKDGEILVDVEPITEVIEEGGF